MGVVVGGVPTEDEGAEAEDEGRAAKSFPTVMGGDLDGACFSPACVCV